MKHKRQMDIAVGFKHISRMGKGIANVFELWKMRSNAPKKKLHKELWDNSDYARIYLHNEQDGHHSNTLEETSNERDLGIRLTKDLKWCTKVKNDANKAKSVLGTLRRLFMYWRKESTKTLYTTFLRPHLEYAASVWNP